MSVWTRFLFATVGALSTIERSCRHRLGRGYVQSIWEVGGWEQEAGKSYMSGSTTGKEVKEGKMTMQVKETGSHHPWVHTGLNFSPDLGGEATSWDQGDWTCVWGACICGGSEGLSYLPIFTQLLNSKAVCESWVRLTLNPYSAWPSLSGSICLSPQVLSPSGQ